VHPIERLRFVARSSGVPAQVLVHETALALRSFRGDHAGLVAACRRVLERQPLHAPLWWLCARMLCALEPAAEAVAVLEEVEADATAQHLAAALPDSATVVLVGGGGHPLDALRRRGDLEVLVVDTGPGSLAVADRLAAADIDAVEVPAANVGAALRGTAAVLVGAFAAGPSELLAHSGSMPAAAAARQLGVPVWLVTGVGRFLPAPMFDGLVQRWSAGVDELDAEEELVPLDLVDRVAGPGGVTSVEEALRTTDCPTAYELLGPTG